MKYYQTEWHDIEFKSFWKVSRKKLANESFYSKFYYEFFKKYKSFDDLNNKWIIRKRFIAKWLKSKITPSSKVLSIGCGIGYIEKILWENNNKDIDLHIHDLVSTSHKWIKEILPEEKIHIGKDIPHGFDIIILTSLDYSFSKNSFKNFLKKISKSLNKNGFIIVISASYLGESNFTPKRFLKDKLKSVQHLFGFRKSEQFWGWMRSRKEYIEIMQSIFTNNYSDGFIEIPQQENVYWIMNQSNK
tara:strand:+ start:1114 stop:1848 length:735 start_codon:yes stop_codon:yes gene_type:complete